MKSLKKDYLNLARHIFGESNPRILEPFNK